MGFAAVNLHGQIRAATRSHIPTAQSMVLRQGTELIVQ
jgi:hypothetical protein